MATFLVNGPLLPCSLRESIWARGMAHPQLVRSNHLPVRLILPGPLDATRKAVTTPFSHTEGRLPPNPDDALVQRCRWTAATAAQDDPSWAPRLGPAERHTYGLMRTEAMEKVFDHLHAAHESLARVVGQRQPSKTGPDPPHPGKDPPKSGVRLQATVLRYDALGACARAAYQTNAALHGIHTKAALWLTEALREASPKFRPTKQNQLYGS